jgi:hypothetical protein
MLVWKIKLLSELSSYMVFMSYSTVMCTGNHLGHSCVVQWLSNLISEYVEGRGEEGAFAKKKKERDSK